MLSSVLIFASACVVALATEDEGGRIYGGTEVSIEDYPHQVSLYLNHRYQCGGSIISDRHILTAAHCVSDYYPDMIQIFSGLNDTKNAYLRSQPSQVVRMSVHRQFDSSKFLNDIALLEVYPPLVLGVTRYPIRLARSEPREGSLLTVTGFGITERGKQSTRLLGVGVEAVGRERCNRSYAHMGFVIGPESICAGFDEGGKDACQGDSGGPIVYNGELVGIVSWGLGCADPKRYGVYTNVPNYLSWIQQHMY